MANIDDWCAELFGYPDKSYFFIKCKKKSDERTEQFLNKNTEGSEGPCPKCGSTNTFPIILQTRSLDEGVSMFIKCGNCDASWNAK